LSFYPTPDIHKLSVKHQGYSVQLCVALQEKIFLGMLNFFPRLHRTKLNVKELDFESMVADEISPLLDVLAHQDTKKAVRFARVIELDVQQRPGGRIHRRFPQLVGVHFAQAFESLYLDAFTADFPHRRRNVAQRSNVKAFLGVCQVEFSR
jgi:hypothetical protein